MCFSATAFVMMLSSSGAVADCANAALPIDASTTIAKVNVFIAAPSTSAGGAEKVAGQCERHGRPFVELTGQRQLRAEKITQVLAERETEARSLDGARSR